MAKFADQQILVVGDLMLDRFIYGSVSRISPEAPVPVVQVTSEKNMPGGASNVAWNIQSLGAQASVSGFVGDDPAAEQLRSLLQREGVEVGGLVTGKSIATTVKTRVIADRQQVVRVDRDYLDAIPQELVDRFCEAVVKEIKRATGVIIEDYGKGVVQQQVVDSVLSAAREAGVPTGFDPKDNHELSIPGVTVATPNRREAFIAVGIPETRAVENPLADKALIQVAERLHKQWQPELLIVTLGPQGMLLVSEKMEHTHVPTRAREVFDVSGAGDTVIAACVLALASGASHVEAAELANAASGVVVGKIGTAACSQAELRESLS
ncbi:MAG: D-glycero-beta-D-manno-heptose-7-phosphate kinase [Verrucomicrobia bacterium]|nr:D-glycero-beta-D-manno-heptose-7-phosphate kinase [Verrucomicrobiota bacterium]